jgi:hypothetical protein
MYRLTRPDPFPIESPKTSAGKKAAKLHAAVTDAHARIVELECAQRDAKAEHVEADRALRAHLLDVELGKAADAPKREAELTAAVKVAADRVAEPWAARLDAAAAAIRSRMAEYAAHVNETAEELLTEPELADAAIEAHEAIVEAIETLDETLARWQEVKRRHVGIVKYAEGLDAVAMPELYVLDDVRRAIGAALLRGPEDIPTPTMPEHALARRAELKTTGKVPALKAN